MTTRCSLSATGAAPGGRGRPAARIPPTLARCQRPSAPRRDGNFCPRLARRSGRARGLAPAPRVPPGRPGARPRGSARLPGHGGARANSRPSCGGAPRAAAAAAGAHLAGGGLSAVLPWLRRKLSSDGGGHGAPRLSPSPERAAGVPARGAPPPAWARPHRPPPRAAGQRSARREPKSEKLFPPQTKKATHDQGGGERGKTWAGPPRRESRGREGGPQRGEGGRRCGRGRDAAERRGASAQRRTGGRPAAIAEAAAAAARGAAAPGEDGERPPRAERRRRARGTSAAGGGQPSPAGSHAAPRPRAADGALSRERGSLGGAGRLSAPSRSAGPLPAGSRVPRRTAEPASPRGRSRLLAASKRGRHGAAPCGGSSGGGLRAAALPGSALVTAARRWLRARRNFRGKRTEAKQSIPAAYRTVPYN
ncbi:translation initiation factor IF-2-like [Gallus gallus]|uniref:translation initiation factor IF-2-like n=1 Tax=Gallus gallus TaxID=9031 RepID=UPI001AE26969|nr:translation initiation factor IF-2-like [Gallus gallus]